MANVDISNSPVGGKMIPGKMTKSLSRSNTYDGHRDRRRSIDIDKFVIFLIFDI